MVPNPSRHGRQSKRNGRGLIERDVFRDLHGVQSNVNVGSNGKIRFPVLEDRHDATHVCRDLRRHNGILLERRFVVREPALEETGGT